MSNEKGVEMSINTVVVVVILLILLAIVASYFYTGFAAAGGEVKETGEVAAGESEGIGVKIKDFMDIPTGSQGGNPPP